jgi:hypothetical protein
MSAHHPATSIARAPRTLRTTRGGAKSSETGPHSPSSPSRNLHAGDSLPSKPSGLPYTRTRRASATSQPSRDTSLATIDFAAHILAAPYFGPNPLFPQHFRGLLRAGLRGRWLSSESQLPNPTALLDSHSGRPPLRYQYSKRYSKIAAHPAQQHVLNHDSQSLLKQNSSQLHGIGGTRTLAAARLYHQRVRHNDYPVAQIEHSTLTKDNAH